MSHIQDLIDGLHTHAGTDFSRLYTADTSQASPEFKQADTKGRASSVMRYALHIMGTALPPQTVIGEKSKDLIATARRFGFHTSVMGDQDPQKELDTLTKNADAGHVSIIAYNPPNNAYGYAVFMGATGHKVILWNPSDAKERSVDREQFISEWNASTEHLPNHWALTIIKS